MIALHRRHLFAAALAAAILALAVSLPDRAGADFRTGVGGFGAELADEAHRADFAARAQQAEASVARINVSWRDVATARPANPADPDDPAYRFGFYDAVVRDLTARGVEPMFTIFRAPDYAEAPNRPPDQVPGSWFPDPGEFAAFAQAVATRYSGQFEGLPRVRYFEIWNEPNLPTFFGLEWRKPGGPARYRALLNGAYAAIKGVDPTNVVIAGATAPFGDDRRDRSLGRMRPLVFLRSLFCLNGKLKPVKKCHDKAKFDVLSHHPINGFRADFGGPGAGGPTDDAANPDDATTPDLDRIARVLHAAERKHTVGGPKRHPLWATEMWWESDPPDAKNGVSLAKQARFVSQSLYEMWRDGAKLVVNLPLTDEDPSSHLHDTLQSGLYFFDGRPKPSLEAFRFPVVADPRSKSKARVWGKAPSSGQLVIERKRGKGWKRLESRSVSEGSVFKANVKAGRGTVIRATVGGESSIPWRISR